MRICILRDILMLSFSFINLIDTRSFMFCESYRL